MKTLYLGALFVASDNRTWARNNPEKEKTLWIIRGRTSVCLFFFGEVSKFLGTMLRWNGRIHQEIGTPWKDTTCQKYGYLYLDSPGVRNFSSTRRYDGECTIELNGTHLCFIEKSFCVTLCPRGMLVAGSRLVSKTYLIHYYTGNPSSNGKPFLPVVAFLSFGRRKTIENLKLK